MQAFLVICCLSPHTPGLLCVPPRLSVMLEYAQEFQTTDDQWKYSSVLTSLFVVKRSSSSSSSSSPSSLSSSSSSSSSSASIPISPARADAASPVVAEFVVEGVRSRLRRHSTAWWRRVSEWSAYHVLLRQDYARTWWHRCVRLAVNCIMDAKWNIASASSRRRIIRYDDSETFIDATQSAFSTSNLVPCGQSSTLGRLRRVAGNEAHTAVRLIAHELLRTSWKSSAKNTWGGNTAQLDHYFLSNSSIDSVFAWLIFKCRTFDVVETIIMPNSMELSSTWECQLRHKLME